MTQNTDIDTGDAVTWDWGTGTAHGVVAKRFDGTVTKTIKGTEITRHGSAETPALLIKQDDGDEVLKLCTEVRRT